MKLQHQQHLPRFGRKTCISTNRLRKFSSSLCLILSVLGMFTQFAFGAAVVEGTVPLTKAESAGVMPSRYNPNITGQVAKPDPPKAVVYLEGNFPKIQSSNLSAAMEQKAFQFAPGLLPVQTGTLVEFPNLDDTYHNVFSYSKSKRFDLGRYRKDEKPAAMTFDKAGAIKLYCEIHEHMRGTILVLDTPYFVKTDADGKFRLGNLPTGSYVLKAWLNEKMILEQPVDLKDGTTVTVNFKSPAK